MDIQSQIIYSYLYDGYKVESQSEHSTILVKKKKFRWILLLASMCVAGFGAFIYLFYYFVLQKDDRIQIIDGVVNRLDL